VGFLDFSEVGTALSDLTGNYVSESFFTGVLNTAGKMGVDIATKEIVSILGPDTRAGQVAQQTASNIANSSTSVSSSSYNRQAPTAVQAPPTTTSATSPDSSMLMLGLIAIILLTRK
jgi:hypothetical protein